MIVGYIRGTYAEKRLIIDKAREYQYVFCDTLWKLKYYPIRLIRKIQHRPDYWNVLSYYRYDKDDVDFIHSFNTVCKTKKPWCVSFESCVPRTNAMVGRPWEKGDCSSMKRDTLSVRELRLLSQDNCIALLALSHSAYRIQLQMLRSSGYKGRQKIIQKMMVLPAPQDVLISAEEFNKKFESCIKCVKFVFIGRNFFGKGGRQVLEAFLRIEKEYRGKFSLTVISDLRTDPFSRSNKDKKIVAETKGILKNKKWIRWFKKLPNPAVLDICRKSHVGLLPSLQETYGYSLLEMQAAGCACITTNIRALSENNHASCGWMCNLKTDSWGGEALLEKDNDFYGNIQILEDSLVEIFKNILDHPAVIKEKGEHSLNRIKTVHNPQKYVEQLNKIYMEGCHR